jgi:hypothetical protein
MVLITSNKIHIYRSQGLELLYIDVIYYLYYLEKLCTKELYK